MWVGNDDNSPMTGVVGGTVPAKLWKKFMTAALTREGLLRPAPVQRSPVDAIGDLVGNVVGDATGEAADAIRDAFGGRRRDDRPDPPEPADPPEPPEPPQPR